MLDEDLQHAGLRSVSACVLEMGRGSYEPGRRRPIAKVAPRIRIICSEWVGGVGVLTSLLANRQTHLTVVYMPGIATSMLMEMISSISAQDRFSLIGGSHKVDRSENPRSG